MIFYDQETADKLRKEAEIELRKMIADACTQVLRAKEQGVEITGETILHFANSVDIPALVATLIFKSGMIFPADYTDKNGISTYPVITYYDNDIDSEDAKVSSAIRESRGRLIGGLVNGRIHT